MRLNTKSHTLLMSSLLITMSGAVIADTTVTFTNSDGAGPSSGMMQVSGTQMRMGLPESAKTDSFLLFDSAKQQFTVINNDEKTYMVFDRETVEQLSDLQNQVTQRMEQAMANLPASQREQMKKMMAARLGAVAAPEPKPRRYERGGRERVGEFDCQMLTVYVGDRKSSEQCVTDADELGIPSQDYQTIRDLQEFSRNMVRQFEAAADQVMDFGELGRDEIPLRYVRHHRDGSQSSGELSQISFEDIDPAVFTIPSGYRRQELPRPPSF